MVDKLLQNPRSLPTTTPQMIVVGLDPGTGASSPTGLFIYNTDNMEILYTAELSAPHPNVDRRIKRICDKLRPIIETIAALEEPFLVSIEFFVMQGKPGEMLHRLIGGFLTLLPDHAEIVHVQNTSVKLLVAGSGKAEKHEVAKHLGFHFMDNTVSKNLIDDLRDVGHYDILDAGAIALAGYMKWQDPNKSAVKKKRKKAKAR